MTLTPPPSFQATLPESASRGWAIFFGWLGVIVSANVIFIIMAATGNYDQQIGDPPTFVIVGFLLSVFYASMHVIGTAIAVFLQSRVVKRHSNRLNVGTAASASVSFVACAGLATLWKPEGDFVALIVVSILITAAITFGFLAALFHWKVILPPLASLCPHCGYPIGTSPVCTECGKAVNPVKSVTLSP